MEPEPEPEEDNSERSRSVARRAERALRNTDYTLAQQLFEEAIELDDENASAYAGLGDVFFQRQEFSSARRFHSRALSHARSNSSYHSKLGMDYFRLGSYERAIESWERTLELDPSDPSAGRYIDIARDRLAQ